MLNKFKSMRAPGASRMTARGSLFGRFKKNNDGVVAVEFALLAPLMLTLMLGALEVTQSIWADGKVEQATSTIGDLISRTPIMTDNELLTLGQAGPLIMRPNPKNDLNFTVSSIIACHSDKDDNTSPLEYYTLWSRIWKINVGNGEAQLATSGHARSELFAYQPTNLDINEGDTLVVTEGRYNYEPTIARKVGTTIGMDGFAYHQPRDKSKRIAYTALEDASKQTCPELRGD